MSYSHLRKLAEERITKIRGAIVRLREEEQQLQAELAALDGPATVAHRAPGSAEEEQPQSTYAFMGPQEAVLRYLQDNPGPHTTDQVHEAVVAGGITTKSKSTRAAVYTALNRQAKKFGTVEKLPGNRWQAITPTASS